MVHGMPEGVSHHDCIGLLRELGFATIHELHGHTLLRRRERIVSVPRAHSLDREVLAKILREACATDAELGDALASLALTRLADGFDDD